MAIARRWYLFVAALFVFLAEGAPVEAQGGLTCGWCVLAYEDPNPVEPGLTEGHRFLAEGGDQCGWEGHDYSGWLWCSRCGNTSECHEGMQSPGYCHIICGPAGDAVAALTEIEQALEDDDIGVVASALLRERNGVSVEFMPAAGRIDLVLPCDPTRAFRTIPVLPEARRNLEYELRILRASAEAQ